MGHRVPSPCRYVPIINTNIQMITSSLAPAGIYTEKRRVIKKFYIKMDMCSRTTAGTHNLLKVNNLKKFVIEFLVFVDMYIE